MQDCLAITLISDAAICIFVLRISNGLRQNNSPVEQMNITFVPQVQLDRTHMIAAHMGQGAPKDMLVTFVIGADDRQCHKNPIVMIIVGNKRFRKVAHCSQTGGLPTWKNYWLLQPVSNHPPQDNLTVSIVGSH